jgi:hypothetical protein
MTTWAEVSRRAGRNDLPYLLVTHWLDLPKTEQAVGLVEAWVSCEWPVSSYVRNESFETYEEAVEFWSELFASVTGGEGFLTDEGMVAPYKSLPERIQVFRGAPEDCADGLSWTTDAERADWFARRLSNESAEVWTTTVKNTDVLAMFNGRKESEIVVDPFSFVDFPKRFEIQENTHIMKEAP